jgi:tRNA (cytidine32/uridine32-2'-O)-methyltransferase
VAETVDLPGFFWVHGVNSVFYRGCFLQEIRIVMVEPTHTGNIGAAARAMKNMGLSQLYLVGPDKPVLDPVAVARASGADDILHSATLCSSLAEALTGVEWVFGASARSRRLDWECMPPRQCAEMIAAHNHSVAIVFGRESSGLSNEELLHCQYHVQIPTVENFSSLNLAQAIQVFAYEIRLATMQNQPQKNQEVEPVATVDKVDGLCQHVQNTLKDMNFMNSKQHKTLVSRLRLLFNRAQLKEVEVNILRGFLSSVQKNTITTKDGEVS